MGGKSVNFEDYLRKLFKKDEIDVNKTLVLKKESNGKNIHLNTSLDIMTMMMMMKMMMMMSLDHYV